MRNIIYIYIVFTGIFFIGCSEDTISEIGTGKLAGTVVEQSTNTPLANVKISTNPASSTTFSDDEGNFQLDEISSGSYSVQAELEGYATAFEAAAVTVDGISNVVFELKTAADNNKAPLMPNLLFPEDGEIVFTSDIEFVWSSASSDSDDITYTLQLRNGRTNSSEIYTIVNDTTFSVSNLELGSSYFWQIAADDSVNDKVQSSISQFQTDLNEDFNFLFTRLQDGNSVIYAGSSKDFGVEFQVTSSSTNSYRPRKNLDVNKIAFLRTSGGVTNIFTANLDGTDLKQITSSIPVNGFRLDEIDFAWAVNGSKIYYPSFDKLYSVDATGGGTRLIYQTTDGSFITEVSTTDFNNNVIALKTNNSSGYGVKIFTLNLSTKTIERTILENVNGAAGGLGLNANASQLIYSRDISGSENDQYRIFQSRLFLYDFNTGLSTQLETDVALGENELDPIFSPSEGSIAFTRVKNNIGATPSIYNYIFNDNSGDDDQLLFLNAVMPDWEE